MLGAGTLALIQDPTGAPIGLWASEVEEKEPDRRLFWPELSTTDTAAAARFYQDLLGWRSALPAAGEGEYQLLHAGTTPVAGILAISARFLGVPSHWLIYVDVPGCEVVASAAELAGARILAPPHVAAGLGIQAVLQDPQGAVFGLIERES